MKRFPLDARGAMRLLRLTGLIIFPIILVFGIDLQETGRALRDAHLGLVLLALLMMQGVIILRAWRWRLAAHASGIHYPRFQDYLVLFYTGLFAGTAMPQLAASFTPALFASEAGRSWRRTVVSIGFDRLVELVVLLAFAFAAAIYLFPVSPKISLAVISGLGGLGIAGLAGLLILRHLRAGKTDDAKPRWRGLVSLLALLESTETREMLKALRERIPAVALLSVPIFVLQAAVVVVLAEALSLDISPVFLAMSWSLVALAVTLPISIVGLGPREGVLVLMFSAAGEPKEAALALGVLLFVVGILTRLPGALAWLPRLSAASAPSGLASTSGAEERVANVDGG